MNTRLNPMNSGTIYEFDNVNGVKLTLKMNSSTGLPKSRKFTISYKNEKSRSSWSKTSLFFAILFNIVAFTFVRISFMAFAYIVIVLSFLTFFWITHSVQSETVLVIPTVGIQTSVKYVWGKEDNFIQWNSIDDIIINEVIKMNRVLFFLTVLVKGNTESNPQDTIKLVPIFQNTKPRLVMLEKINYELQLLLTESIMQPHSGDADTCKSDQSHCGKEGTTHS